MKNKFLILLLVATMLTSCGDSDSDDALVRFLHLSPDAGLIDIQVDEESLRSDDEKFSISSIQYLESTGYIEVPDGLIDLEVRTNPEGELIVDEDEVFDEDESYTVIVADIASSADYIIIEDDRQNPPAGFGSIRAIHGAPSFGTVDIYITDPDAELPGNPSLEDVDFQDVGPYVELPAGQYRIRVTPANVPIVAADSGTITLENGQIASAIARDAEGGGAPISFLYLDDTVVP